MIKRLLMSLRLVTCQNTHTKKKPPPATTGTPRNKQQDINGYSIRDTRSIFFFFFFEWEHRTGTMRPFSSLYPLKKGKEV